MDSVSADDVSRLTNLVINNDITSHRNQQKFIFYGKTLKYPLFHFFLGQSAAEDINVMYII